MNFYEDLRSLRTRLEGCRWLTIALFLVLCVRFWQLQVLRAPLYRELARANHVRQIPETAPRGIMIDRHAQILAENRPSFNLTLDNPADGSGSATPLAALAALVSLSESELSQQVSQARTRSPYSPVLVKEDIPLDEVALIEARELELPHSVIQFVPRRFYPRGNLASHVLGHVGRLSESQLDKDEFRGAGPNDYVGQSGVELVYNQTLMGRNGVQRVVVNSHGRRERILEEIPPLWGDSVQLTLDLDLQRAAEQAFEGKAGAVAVLDPSSGEVLALGSFPSFDPNLFSGRFEKRAWQALVDDPDHRLQNRAIQGRYAPGSVFKLVVAAAALEEGVISPATRYFCPGWLSLYGVVFRCHQGSGHGWVDLHQALVRSCNAYFYQVGVLLQIDRIARYARAFGLGGPTGIDLPFEASGLVPDPDWKRRSRREPWYAGETVSVAVGQGSVLVTTIQMAQLAAAIGTAGKVYRPHLFLRALGAAESQAPAAHSPVEPARRISLEPSTWRELQEAMWGTVHEGGTGYRAQIDGVEVCGKTGTAQVASRANLSQPEDRARPENLRNHAWFIGYAPRHNPELALAVLVEHGGAGGQSAAPLAREIFRAYFQGEVRRTTDDARQALLVRN